jgi:hypothetical protein
MGILYSLEIQQVVLGPKALFSKVSTPTASKDLPQLFRKIAPWWLLSISSVNFSVFEPYKNTP